MEQLLDMDFDYEDPLDFNDSGHTDATTMTCMSDDCDEDIDRMIGFESEATFRIDTHTFDPPYPVSCRTTTTVPAAKVTSRPWSTFSNLRNSSLGSLFGSVSDQPGSSFGRKSTSCSSTSDRSGFNQSYYDDPLLYQPIEEIQEPPMLPIPVPFRLRRKSSPSYDNTKQKEAVHSHSPYLVGDLNFETFHVSPSSSPTFKKGKFLSQIEHPLATKVKRGLRNVKRIAVGVSKKDQIDCSMSVSTADDDISKSSARLGQKRCRRQEPCRKEYVDITDFDVLLGRGGLSNRHPGNKAYRKHILDHQKEYKGLENSKKTQMSKDVVAWVKGRGGRFLKRDDDVPGKPFYIATDVTARQKVSQALREDHTPEGREQKKSRTKAHQN